MDFYERQDELQEIIDTLESLINNITDKNYTEIFYEIKRMANEELDEVQDKLYQIEKTEKKEQEKEYWNTQF